MGGEEVGRHVSCSPYIKGDPFAKRKTLMGLLSMNDSSDADSDVLADYVLALIRADTPDEDSKKNAIENLEDFLRDSKS